MSDLPPDAARLRVLRTYLALQLAEVDEAIAAAEREQAPRVPPPAPPAAAPRARAAGVGHRPDRARRP